jgi:hypothetical protein
MQKIRNYINGSFQDPKHDQWIDNYNPSNGDVYSLIPNSSSEDVEAAYQAAKKAYDTWSNTTVEYRSDILSKIARLIKEQLSDLAYAESKDNGKPLSLASTVDIPRASSNFQFFDKVEIVRFEHPETSYDALDGMVNHVKEILRDLKLPYRILRLCGGDLSFTAALTYDFELFSTAQDKWLEISSISNFENYQANRLKLRFKGADGKKQLAHTLNGSALALPRVLAGILENYQTPEGIKIPECLVPYTGFDLIS